MEPLSEKELSSIVPFSGTPQEMTAAEKVMSQGGPMQRVQTAYTTAVAVQKPRSIARITKNVLEEAKLAGPGFYYRWEVKNKKTGRKSLVQGASIDLAMCLARNYGNCALDIEVQETSTHFHFKGSFIDLETGFTVPRLYRQRKKQDIGGGYGDDRAEDMVFQIGQSKAQRNAIVKAAPNWLIEQAIEVAREAEINKIKPEHLALARARAIQYFETHGVTQERLEATLESPADNWTAENIVDLKGMATALKEGRVTAEELFPPIEEAEVEEAKTSLYEEAKGPRKPGYAKWVKDNIERIKVAPENDQKKIRDRWIKFYPDELYPLDPVTEEGMKSTETSSSKEEKNSEEWSGLYYDCPDMAGEAIAKAKCNPNNPEHCPKLEGCPNPFKPGEVPA